MSSNGAYSRYTASPSNASPYGQSYSTGGGSAYGGGYGGSAPVAGYGGASYSAPTYNAGGMDSSYGQVCYFPMLFRRQIGWL